MRSVCASPSRVTHLLSKRKPLAGIPQTRMLCQGLMELLPRAADIRSERLCHQVHRKHYIHLVTAVVLATSASSPFPYKPLQQECQEVGEGIELAIEANVFVP